MAKWTDYTIDTNPTDTDEVMTLDADKSPKANKRVTLSTLADYFLDKLASKVFAKLETKNQTVIGALNELNSKALTTIDATYDSITIPSSGYISLQKENLMLDNIKMATIYFYQSIEPKAAISVYADYKGGFLFGTPGTTVKDLRVRFWKFTK